MEASEETMVPEAHPRPAQLEDHDWNMFKDRVNGVTVRYYSATLTDQEGRPISFYPGDKSSMERLDHLRELYSRAGYEIVGPDEGGWVELRDYRFSANGRLEIEIADGIISVSASGVFEGLIGPDDSDDE